MLYSKKHKSVDKGGGDFMALKDELMVLINSKYPIIYVENFRRRIHSQSN
jgi:hypothetical protein